MIGNGGWSYTLNNKTPDKVKYPFPRRINSLSVLDDTSLQGIYDGRTPCQDFALENNLTVDQSCFKLKWKLVLNRDPNTLKPSTYSLFRTNSRETDIRGSWIMIKGFESDLDAVIIQLDPDNPDRTISLFVGDENILFFLHNDKSFFVGNDNFSFTLNKRPNRSK